MNRSPSSWILASPDSVPAVAAVLVLVAMLLDLGPLHLGHEADSLIPILVSLYRWQPFLWEQDRYGALVPLLATGIHHPFANLLVQNLLTAVAALCAFFALARIATERFWVIAGSIAATLFLVTESEAWRFQTFSTYAPFAQGLGIAAVGAAVLVAGERLGARRLFLGTLLLVLGSWVYSAAACLLVPALVMRAVFSPHTSGGSVPAKRTGIAIAVATVSVLVSAWLTSRAPVRMKYAILPLSEWPSCWAGLVRNAIGEDLLGARHLSVLAVLLVAGTAALAVRGGRGRAALAAVLPPAAGAGALVAAMGTINWPRSQGLGARYSLDAVVALDVGFAGFAAVALFDAFSPTARRRVSAAALAVLVGVAVVLGYPPSLHRVRVDLDRAVGARSAEVIDAGITHVAGSFWTVWPTVYHANLLLYERGSRRKIWGIAHRASPTADRWATIPLAGWRVAAIPEEFQDPWTARVLHDYHLPPLRPVGRLRTFTLLVVDTVGAK